MEDNAEIAGGLNSPKQLVSDPTASESTSRDSFIPNIVPRESLSANASSAEYGLQSENIPLIHANSASNFDLQPFQPLAIADFESTWHTLAPEGLRDSYVYDQPPFPLPVRTDDLTPSIHNIPTQDPVVPPLKIDQDVGESSSTSSDSATVERGFCLSAETGCQNAPHRIFGRIVGNQWVPDLRNCKFRSDSAESKPLEEVRQLKEKTLDIHRVKRMSIAEIDAIPLVPSGLSSKIVDETRKGPMGIGADIDWELEFEYVHPNSPYQTRAGIRNISPKRWTKDELDNLDEAEEYRGPAEVSSDETSTNFTSDIMVRVKATLDLAKATPALQNSQNSSFEQVVSTHVRPLELISLLEEVESERQKTQSKLDSEVRERQRFLYETFRSKRRREDSAKDSEDVTHFLKDNSEAQTLEDAYHVITKERQTVNNFLKETYGVDYLEDAEIVAEGQIEKVRELEKEVICKRNAEKKAKMADWYVRSWKGKETWISKLKGQLNYYVVQQSHLTQQLESLAARYKDLEGKKIELEFKITELGNSRREVGEIEVKISDKEKELHEDQDKFGRAEREIKELSQHVEQNQGEVAEAKTHGKTKLSEVEEAKYKAFENFKEDGTNRRKLEDSRWRAQECRQKAKLKAQEADQERQEAKKASQDVEQSEQVVQKVKDEVKILRQQVSLEKERLKASQSRVEEAVTCLHEAKDTLGIEKKSIQDERTSCRDEGQNMPTQMYLDEASRKISRPPRYSSGHSRSRASLVSFDKAGDLQSQAPTISRITERLRAVKRDWEIRENQAVGKQEQMKKELMGVVDRLSQRLDTMQQIIERG